MSLLLDQVTVQLLRCDCAHCGLTFGLSREFTNQRRNDHKGFYCPNGHNNYYPQKSDAEIAREERDRALRQSEFYQLRSQHLSTDLKSAHHKITAERGAKTKLRKKLNRVSHGVCPCCNRTFQNLLRHITSKHPTFVSAVDSDSESK